MKLKLFSALLVSASMLAGGSAFAAAHPADLDNFNNAAAKPAAPAAAAPAPKKVKKAKKAKAAPAATAKASQANIYGSGTVTGPIDVAAPPAAPAPAPASK
jgi:hypothetical protein